MFFMGVTSRVPQRNLFFVIYTVEVETHTPMYRILEYYFDNNQVRLSFGTNNTGLAYEDT